MPKRLRTTALDPSSRILVQSLTYYHIILDPLEPVTSFIDDPFTSVATFFSKVVVYAYTGTWIADFPMNHYTHWVGLLLKPSDDEILGFKKAAEVSISQTL